jgi:type 2A phosphatase activator TIP41
MTREKTHEGIKEVVKPFDWSYTTDYKGTITKGKSFEPQKDNSDPIPIELLKRPDPILFYEEVVLYESELDDNGISLFSCKLRVMPDRMLLLSRLFMRLDNVVIRMRDTRIYVDFKIGKVIRDYTEKEDSFDAVKRVSIGTESCWGCQSFTRIPFSCFLSVFLILTQIRIYYSLAHFQPI